MKDIPSGMRVNATHIICFNLRNKKEQQDFLSENNAIDGLENHYQTATKDPYNFLYINKQANKAFHNFERDLTEK